MLASEDIASELSRSNSETGTEAGATRICDSLAHNKPAKAKMVNASPNFTISVLYLKQSFRSSTMYSTDVTLRGAPRGEVHPESPESAGLAGFVRYLKWGKRALRSHDIGERTPPSGWLEGKQPAEKRRRHDDNDRALVHGKSPHPETGLGPASVTDLAGRSAQVTQDFIQAQENRGKILGKSR